MRHPLITAAAIAGVVLAAGAQARAGQCPAEHESPCHTDGMTDVSAARKQTPARLQRHAARDHRSKVRSHHHGRLKLRHDDARSMPARPSPAAPSPTGPLAAVAASAPELAAIAAPADGSVVHSIARRMAETFNMVGSEMRHSQREDPLTARAQAFDAPAPNGQSAATKAAEFVAAAPSASIDGKRTQAIDGIQALPLIAFGSLGATFLMYITFDSARRRRARGRPGRRSCRWPSASQEVENTAVPASLP
jgi:hypothetical protein